LHETFSFRLTMRTVPPSGARLCAPCAANGPEGAILTYNYYAAARPAPQGKTGAQKQGAICNDTPRGL